MGIIDGLMGIIGGNVTSGEIPKPPGQQYPDLNAAEANELRALFKNWAQSRDWQLESGVLGDQYASELGMNRRSLADSTARVGGVQSGAYTNALNSANQGAYANYMDTMRKAANDLLQQRTQRLAGLTGRAADFAARTYGPYVQGRTQAAVGEYQPWADFARGWKDVASASGSFAGSFMGGM